jgi:hypothetical protein
MNTKTMAAAGKAVFVLALAWTGLGVHPGLAGTDFNKDGRDDIITFLRDSGTGNSQGNVYVAASTGTHFGAGVKWQSFFCIHQEVPACGDFNGDGRDDVVTFLRNTGSGDSQGDVYVALSNGTGFNSSQKWHTFFCIGNEIPMVGDFNGDGKDDIVTFLRNSGSGDARGDVYVALSAGYSFGPGQKWHDWFCINDEIPLVGDFNGDGKDDIVTFLRNSGSGDARGNVYVALSTGSGFGPGQKWHDFFCVNNEIPLVGDFNGDGKDDIVAFGRGDSGDVYVALSNGSSFVGQGVKWHDYFCIGNEIPMVGDFNGDGKSDLACFAHETKSGNGKGDVYVALSTGAAFGPGQKWHDWFCVHDEVPTLTAALFPQYVFAESHEDTSASFVGYASDEEDRFYDNVWDFKDEFESTWTCTQYFWGQRRFMQEDHLSYVDSADLAFVSGHGNTSFIAMASGQDCDLQQCAWGSWSSHSRKGDLEYIAFESCKVLSLEGDWRARWSCSPNRMRPFAGLHVAGGFKNNHVESPVYEVSDEFAENLEDGYSVRWAWLEAADNENTWVWGHDNLGCVIYLRPHKNETIGGYRTYDRWYHDSDYILDAEYWEY